MNNLHRALAPISDAAWSQIEEETARTFKRYLAGRRVVDVQGPGGVALSAVGTGHLRNVAAPGDGILARQREVNALTIIVEDGKEVKIIRDNMPFGRAAEKEFGTYFIGYARSPRTIEQMLENMFVGRPPGNYDRLLDFTTAKTGNLFFVPSATFLENIVNDAPPAGQELADAPAAAPLQREPTRDGSLGIGSLKGDYNS
jgi:hypothetical protein